MVSMSSNAARKAAPPIPRKPALLRHGQDNQGSKMSEQGKSVLFKPPSGGSALFDDGAKTRPPPPPPRTRQQEVNEQRAAEPDKLPLPLRSIGASVSLRSGLMDADSECASTTPSLQPMRHQQERS